MAESITSEKRQQRNKARERRRSLASDPFEEMDETAREDDQQSGDREHETLKQVATTAVAGAVAAGIAGAAKALRERGGDDSDSSGARDAATQNEQTEPDDDAPSDALEQDPGTGDDEADEREEESREPEPRAEGDPGAEPQSSSEPEPESEPDPEQRDDEPTRGSVRGASDGDAKKIVDKARGELQDLLGVEPEGVSGFERSNGQWTVTLEVVEVKRIPESTDVLSTYAVTFDDDHKLISVSQRRRYRRSQVEEG
jgi:Gas vesicle synthesis protein GvpO